VTTSLFADGLHLAECPRWHDGSLWMCDMWGHTVNRFDLDGTRHVVHTFPDDEDPGGLGWLPDGRLLVVGMDGRCVYRLEGDRAVVHADLRDLAPWHCNDMVVADDGTAYVTQFGFDFFGGSTSMAPTTMVRVSPDGHADVVAGDLSVPNGVALTSDGRHLVVAEPGAGRITRFDVAPDGTLSGREVFAELVPIPGAGWAAPDGICLDADGAVWAAEPLGKRVLRVEAGGRVLEEIAFEAHPLAVCLGGSERRTLFICVAGQYHKAHRDPTPMARIETLTVDVPGAGRP